MKPILKIHLFGGINIYRNDQPITTLKSRKAEALFVYLLLNQRPFNRTELAAIFWDDSDEEQARRNLRRTLSDLRNQLDPWLAVTRHTLAFNPDTPYWLDCHAIQESLDQWQTTAPQDELLTPDHAQQLATALGHYQGELLAGLYLNAATTFDEWLAFERERWRLQIHNALLAVTTHYFYYGHYQQAILTAQKLIKFDPWREDGQQLLARAYARLGQRPLALRAYQQYAQTIAAELDITPEPTFQQYVTCWQTPPPPTTTPQYAFPFIERDQELAQLDYWLDYAPSSLITIQGLGGIGKTRLALALQHRRHDEFQHGSRFISLAPLTHADQLDTALALAFNLPTAAHLDTHQQLRDYLRPRHHLIILDNIEHLLPAAANWLQDLMTATPHVTYLVTSRERLFLHSEQLFVLSHLAIPPIDTDQPAEYATVRFFKKLTQQSHPELDTNAIAHLCRLVEGWPLALELAAAALHELDLATIQAGIQEQLDFLTNRFHDTPQRHHSLAATLGATWQRLTPQQQTDLITLSLFVSDFSQTAATNITQMTTDRLATLVAKSVVREESNGRYSLHPFIRQYVQNNAPPPTPNQQQRYYHYYLRYLSQHGQQLHGPNPHQILPQLDTERAHIRAAWHKALTAQDIQSLSSAIPHLYTYYNMRSWFRQGYELFATAHEQWPTTTPPTEGAYLTTIYYAAFAQRLGHNEQAETLLNPIITTIDTLPPSIAHPALLVYIELLINLGQHEKGVQVAQQAITIAQQLENELFLAEAIVQLGRAHQDLGHYQQALTQYEQALTSYQKHNNQWRLAATLNQIGTLAGTTGNYDQAEQYFQQARTLYQQLNDSFGLAQALQNLSILAFLAERYQDSLSLREEVLRICQDIGYLWGQASILRHIGDAHRRLGNLDTAYQHYQQSQTVCHQINDMRGLTLVTNSLGSTALARQQIDQAQAHFRQALDKALIIPWPPVALSSLLGLARTYHHQQKPTIAYRLAYFAQQHPASEQQQIDDAQQLLTELEDGVTTAVITQLQTEIAPLLQQNLPDIIPQLLST